VNDVLDDQLRTLMKTAVRDAPAAPAVDVLGIVEVRAEAPLRRGRPLLIAAAVIAVVVAGVVVARRPTAEVEPADTAPPSVVPGSYLDAYYLPTTLPEGWRIIEVTRTPAPAQTDRAGNVIVFERRDLADRAMVSLEPLRADPTQPTLAPDDVANTEFAPSGTEPPDPGDSAATADWSDDTKILSWPADGQFVMVTVRSGNEAAARQVAASLMVTSTDHGRSFDIDPASDWVRLHEYLLDGETLPSFGSNSLTLGTATGASVAVSIQHDGPTSVLDMAVRVDAIPGVYDSSSGGDPSAVRREGEIAILAFPISESEVSQDDLRQLVSSVQRVTVEQWDAAATAVETLLESSPVVSRFAALGYDVTVHVDGALRGVCISRSDVTGCQRFGGIDEAGRIPPAMPTTGIELTDGTWVAVGSIGADR
jgi:hypothetical protein